MKASLRTSMTMSVRAALSLSLFACSALLAHATWAPAPAGSATPLTLPRPTPSVDVRPHVTLDRVTYYNAVPGQTDSDPFTSACGPNRPNQVAVSRDLFRSTLHCGDVVEVWLAEGYMGRYVVWDTMAPRFTNTLDVLTETSMPWGKTTGHLVLVE